MAPRTQSGCTGAGADPSTRVDSAAPRRCRAGPRRVSGKWSRPDTETGLSDTPPPRGKPPARPSRPHRLTMSRSETDDREAGMDSRRPPIVDFPVLRDARRRAQLPPTIGVHRRTRAPVEPRRTPMLRIARALSLGLGFGALITRVVAQAGGPTPARRPFGRRLLALEPVHTHFAAVQPGRHDLGWAGGCSCSEARTAH